MKRYETLGHTKGRDRTPTYQAWRNMISRCTNKKRPDYQFYGARGIIVCDRWLNSFGAFLSDIGERPEGKSLDRRDNEKGYNKANCRWASRDEQMQNTRATRLMSLRGETMGLNAWARKLGMTHSSIQGRLRRGWSIEKTLTQPKGRM